MINKKGRYEYEILEEYTAGIVLTGSEIKSLREGLCVITDSYCVLINNELIIRNMYIGQYNHNFTTEQETKRDRKLLITKKEIKRLTTKLIDKGITIIPLKVTVGKLAKIEIALAKGKNVRDKKMSIKLRDLDREFKRNI
jgi:SsrA-binding protein